MPRDPRPYRSIGQALQERSGAIVVSSPRTRRLQMRCAGTPEPSASLSGAMCPSARETPYEGSLLVHRRIDPFFAPYLLRPVSHSPPLSLSKWCLILIGGRGRTWRGVQLLPMTPALVTASDVQAYLSLARPYSSPNRRSRMRTSTTKASAPIA